MTTIDTTVAAPAQSLLSAHQITKRYGGVRALVGATIDLRIGEVHGIIGPNGAGKSTLVKILAGIEQPDGGTISIDGETTTYNGPHDAQRRGVVLMPQEIGLIPDGTLVDNIVLGAEPRRFGSFDRAAARERAVHALGIVGLDLDPKSSAGDLSTVHRRLLMLARAMDKNARLLILDEPTAGLASHEATVIKQTVERLKKQGVTVVYISHHLTEVASLCDRVTCVREGSTVATLSKNTEGTELTKNNLVNLILGLSIDRYGRSVTPERDAIDSEAILASGIEATPRHAAPITIGANQEIGIAGRELTGPRLHGVSFEAPKGGVTGFTGLLGSGVTELISIVAGSLTPTAGEVVIDGRPVSLPTPAHALHHGIGYLAGDRTTVSFPAMSIRENLTISALGRWFGRTGIIRRGHERSETRKVLDTLSVLVDPERAISTLSGGNQQRALVGRLIAADVTTLILNEPTVGVDIRARKTLWDAVKALSNGRTVIVASGEPEELVALCDRVVCLRGGTVSEVLDGDAITVEALTQAVT